MKRYVIAASKPYYRELPARLEQQCGAEFLYIDSPDQFTLANLRQVQPRYVFLPHWSFRIPAEIWQAFECVVFHMTDLPYGRGGSPLQNLIVRGHDSTVISALRCVEGLDEGPIYLKSPLSLAGSAGEIFQRAAIEIGQMIACIVQTEPTAVPQTGEPVVFARRRPEEGDVGGLTDLAKVYDYIRMLDAEGYPPAFLEAGNLHLDFSHATKTDCYVEATVRIRLKHDE